MQMKIKLLYFAQLREKTRASEEDLELPAGSTVNDLRQHLLKLYPQMKNTLDGVAIAVNLEYTKDERKLSEGDSVALIPPVSGGRDDQDS